MSEMRGWLIGLVEGSCELDEVEDYIESRISKAMKSGYEYGYIDGRIKRLENPRLDLLRAVQSVELTPIGISARGELFEQLRGAKRGRDLSEFYIRHDSGRNIRCNNYDSVSGSKESR